MLFQVGLLEPEKLGGVPSLFFLLAPPNVYFLFLRAVTHESQRKLHSQPKTTNVSRAGALLPPIGFHPILLIS